jgi:hypothetical protein
VVKGQKELEDGEMGFSKIDYCHYLIATQVNYTITNMADHCQWSHDRINRYLRQEELTPAMLWENAKAQIVRSANGYVIFDDTVLDKNYAKDIELSRRLYSGCKKKVIRGIGLVSLVYVNPETEQFWVIDYRIYDPQGDGKTKIDHFAEMFEQAVINKRLTFSTVLMDSWYATTRLMLLINQYQKFFCCPVKRNRKVDDSGGNQPYQSVEQLQWTESELEQGKLIKIRKFPKDMKVKLFQVTTSIGCMEYLVTNDLTANQTDDVQQENAIRWKIEEFHRELKQLTGIEDCQCRKARIQRNHIACALLVWLHLKRIAYQSGVTIYQLKRNLMSDYLKSQLKSPSILMTFA